MALEDSIPVIERQKLPFLAAVFPHWVGHVPPCLAALAIVGASGAGCANTDENQVIEPTVVGMTDKLAAAYDDGQLAIYQVQVPVRLPMRPPKDDAERAALRGGVEPPLPRQPFLKASDVRIEIRFTLSNLDNQQHAVELLIDPWNEFVRYKPGIQQVNDEEAVPDFSGYDKFFIVPAKSRVVGTITPDDCTEMAIDLATAHRLIEATPEGVTNVNGLVNHAFNLQNRSSQPSPLIAPYLPKVVPGLIGFDLGLRSYAPANMAVEVIVDVTDVQGDRVTPPDEKQQPMSPQHALEPPKAAEM
jgi:hypothetical protein